jgi:cysteinyl-tRNA synthetase
MAKSTGNNILPREILTGENTILSKAFCIGSSIFHVTSTLQKHSWFFWWCNSCRRKRINDWWKQCIQDISASKSTIDIPAWKQVLWCDEWWF